MLPVVRLTSVLLLTACTAPPTWGTTIDRSPRPARILAGGDRFLAQDGMESVTLYGADGRPIHTFPTAGRPAALDVTADEQVLLLASEDGGVGLWSLDTGKPVWRVSASKAGLDGVYDACLSHDGRFCVVCNTDDFALVLDARSGARVGRVSFPPRQTNIMSAALAPDGRTGVLIDLGERVFAFDVATGAVRDTGLSGAWPIRFAADGRHVACRSDNSGSAERLRVIATDTWKATDVGRFSHIGHIRPLPGGGFQATAQMDDRSVGTSDVVGVRYTEGAAEPVEVWRRPTGARCDIRTDFGGNPVRGVSTDFRLVTQLTDLSSGNPVRVIDNSAKYQPTVVTWSSSGPDWRWWAAGLGVVAIVLAAAITLWIRRGR